MKFTMCNAITNFEKNSAKRWNMRKYIKLYLTTLLFLRNTLLFQTKRDLCIGVSFLFVASSYKVIYRHSKKICYDNERM